MKPRIRFDRQRVRSAFNKAYKYGARRSLKVNHSQSSQILIDPDLLDGLAQRDKDALDEMVKEMDEALGEILEKDKAKAAKKKVSEGEKCTKCDNFYPYAEPNQPDGTLICYGCRKFG